MTNFNNPNELKHEMDFYTFKEFQKYIAAEPELKFQCIFKTFYYCGLRKGELRGLTWKDINLEDGLLHVRQNVVTTHGPGDKFIICSPKTLKSIRTIPVPRHLIHNLKQYKKECKKDSNFNENYFVFGDTTPISNDAIYRRNKKISSLANVKKIRIHDFRHSCASLLINNNASITLVANYLGHTKIDETLNTYSHLYKNSLSSLMKILNKLE